MKHFEMNEDNGRHKVFSRRTGKTYIVEPIGSVKTDWGSYNPGTGKVENKKGAGKHQGSIHPSESVITEENGFKNIKTVKGSPYSEIEKIDSQYPTVEGYNG